MQIKISWLVHCSRQSRARLSLQSTERRHALLQHVERDLGRLTRTICRSQIDHGHLSIGVCGRPHRAIARLVQRTQWRRVVVDGGRHALSSLDDADAMLSSTISTTTSGGTVTGDASTGSVGGDD
jgi:hypothetical protein